MTDGVSPLNARTSEIMARVRQKRTAPEQRVADTLRRLGVRYRRNVAALPGSPDFANRARGWAILVHGCFWHSHDCSRGTRPRHNATFWNAKLDRNRARDAEVEAALTAAGLRVLTVWECELRDTDMVDVRLRAFLALEERSGFMLDGRRLNVAGLRSQ